MKSGPTTLKDNLAVFFFFFNSTNILLLHNPTIMLLGIMPTEKSAQPRYSLVGEGIKNL